MHFISALTGAGVDAMFEDALEIAGNVHFRVGTGQLNDVLRRAMAEHPVPSAKGKPVKIRYATQAETAPPRIILFCNSPDNLHFSYVRHLENVIRKNFPFRGVPLVIEVRKGSGERTREERLQERREAGLEATRLSDEAKGRGKRAKCRLTKRCRTRPKSLQAPRPQAAKQRRNQKHLNRANSAKRNRNAPLTKQRADGVRMVGAWPVMPSLL